MKNLIIIDGHNYMFRAFYGVPKVARTKSGQQVNAVYGFFAFLRRTVALLPNHHIFVVFDSETGTDAKHAEMEAYKANRNNDESVFGQLPIIKAILDDMGVKWLEHPDYEADDIIASAAANWMVDNDDVFISSEDMDFVQLLCDRVSLIRSFKGKPFHFDCACAAERLGIPPKMFVDYRALIGDKSDNIRGIPGIGPKTAVELLNQYGDLQNIFSNISDITPGLSNKLASNREIAFKNQKFITMNACIPDVLPTDLPMIANHIINQKITALLDKIGIE